ncbi:MAG TPA: glutamate racemase [Candidatus Polarisedimenticolaceae bacterium]|nr:glutamate racemase [Candidatus Polarisedimenticolaceae bacterium]
MPPHDDRPIGVFDSGVGGLTVFHALEQALPRETMVYLGDTARVPYGGRSAETVRRYTREAARFMLRQQVKMVVVACNTASSVALDSMEHEAGLPVIGVIVPGAARAVDASPTGRIGVIGTRATVGSGAYKRAIQELRPDAEVLSQACPLFVPLAEEGWTDGEITRRIAESYLRPFQRAEVDTLVLGCTHYPLLRGVIGEVMGRGVTLVDSAESVADEAARRLAAAPELAGSAAAARGARDEGREHHFYVTDAPETFQVVAERFLGRPIRCLEWAALDRPSNGAG